MIPTLLLTLLLVQAQAFPEAQQQDPSTEGAAVEGIAPGDYKVFSWEKVEVGAWQHPDFIRNYEDRGETVRIGSLGSDRATVRMIAAGD
jgi:hypothetical protein